MKKITYQLHDNDENIHIECAIYTENLSLLNDQTKMAIEMLIQEYKAQVAQ